MDPTTKQGALTLCEQMAQKPGNAILMPTDSFPDEVVALARAAYMQALGQGEPSPETWRDAARLLRSGYPVKPARWAITSSLGDDYSCIEDSPQAAELFAHSHRADVLPHGARLQLQAVAADGHTRVGPVLHYEVTREGLGGFTVGVKPV